VATPAPARERTPRPARRAATKPAASDPTPQAVDEIAAAHVIEPEPAAAVAAKELGVLSNSELVETLRQQTEALSRLTSELETQRALIAQQREAIASLEARASAPVAPARPAAAPASMPLPTPTPAPPAPTVDTSGARLRLGGLVQGWFTTGSGVTNTFRLRRTELKLTGELNPRTRWTMMVDPAKTLNVANSYTTIDGTRVVSDSAVNQGGRMLQDAFISLAYSPSFSVELGQQRLPFGSEGTQSASRLDTMERALYMSDRARGGSYGDVRDLGVIARGQLAHGRLEYSGGLFNGLGESMNDVDRNDQKAIAGRLVARPGLTGLQVGGSYARGALTSLDTGRRDRSGVEIGYARGRYGFRSEFVAGWDGAIPRRGYYAQGTARLTARLQAVVRQDVWDPDTRNEATAATVTETDWVTGLNFQPTAQKVLLQVNYAHKAFMSVQPARDVLGANVQASW